MILLSISLKYNIHFNSNHKTKKDESLMREYQIPKDIEDWIESHLATLSLSLKDSTKLAQAIQFQSDFYINNPDSETPWEDIRAQLAQMSYYFPLNFLRNLSVLKELINHINLNDFEYVLDYGAGLGASSWALRHLGYNNDLILLEKNSIPKKWYMSCDFKSVTRLEEYKKLNSEKTLGIFSYSLTEIQDKVELLKKFSSLVVIEPSTQQDGRSLSEVRQKLIDMGYQIIAPCTHQKECPLIKHSNRDWCHDRIHFKKNKWFENIEKHLPFKNDTLTFSYLIATRSNLILENLSKKMNSNNLESSNNFGSKLENSNVINARIIGDLLKEKGKNRQLACFDDERWFLAWLHKNKNEQIIPRGKKVLLPTNTEKKSNELRITQKIEIID